MTTTIAAAAEYIATEIAWNGSASDAWIARKLTAAGHTVDAAKLTEFAVTEGLLKPIPRLGGYTAGRKVNAAVFGERFAEFIHAGEDRTVAEALACGTCGQPVWEDRCAA